MKILFVYPILQPFVQKDLDILRSTHDVCPIQFSGREGLTKRLLPDLWQLWQGVLWCDLTFSWFGKLHGFFAVLFSRILGKKSVVVAGGDDVTDTKPFGMCSHPIGKWIAKFTFQRADCIITISKYLSEETLRNTQVRADQTKLIYHGFDPYVFQKPPHLNKNGSVVTVAHISWENYRRKGLKLFVQSAHLTPKLDFRLIGPVLDRSHDALRQIAPPNVTFIGGLYGSDLVRTLGTASVYVQTSEWESFGCSLAEAMLCECVPVVSRLTALPEVVGDCGIYVERLDPQSLALAIEEALRNPSLGQRARERIIREFPLAKRRAELLRVIASFEETSRQII